MTGSDVVAALRQEREARLTRAADLRRALQEMSEAGEGSNADDEHDPEGATLAFERSQVQTQLALTRSGVDDVDAALARVADGSYGRCVRCGQEVAGARLRARPTAATCLGCAST